MAMEHSPDSITLTPNRRLAATLVKQYQQSQIKLGKLCWPTLKIMPLSSWLENLWVESNSHDLAPAPLLLTSSQEQILWEEIIRKSPESYHLLQVSRTAKMAMSAWELLKQWKIDPSLPELSVTDDGEIFQVWAKQFQKLFTKNNWLDHASLVDSICQSILQQKISLPQKINLTGFIEISPQIQNLLDVCRRTSIVSVNEQEALHNDTSEDNVRRIALSDKETEIVTMARWAKALHDKHSFSEIKVGCIIPDLENCRDEVQRIFLEVFNAEAPFNISAGRKLATYPVIHTAINILNLITTRVPIAQFSHLLRSPFIGDAEQESQRRALYDHYLHNLNISTLSLNNLISEKSTLNFSTHCPLFAKYMQQYLLIISNRKKQLSPSQWANYFSELLLALGWPGERSLNSEEYQVIQNCWLPLLSEFSRLDTTLPIQNQQKALHYLTQMAQNTIFQSQTPEAPIQILGTLEAAGLAFDQSWVMGLDDTAWPAAPSPNPFIPLRLQKQLNMPNASADRELIYSQKLTKQFVKSSSTVIFSYSEKNQETILRPSALIKNFPILNENNLSLSSFTQQATLIFDHQQTESLEDAIAPPLLDNEVLRGGTNIFKFQAACPFKAFGELRLNAHYIEPPSEGLNAQDRGKIIHKVLELLWVELKDSSQLHALDHDSLTTLLSQCITQAFDQSHAVQNNGKNSRYLTIEKLRFKNLLMEWLALEKERPGFRVIACEQEHEITLGKINFKLRIDRIDELVQGGKLIIDYKTGKYSEINSWFGARPDEPQLPLYCALDPGNIGITFAELHPDAIKFKGVSKKSLDIPGIKPIAETKQSDAMLWEEQIKQWQHVLTKLGDDFYHGVAIVDPKDGDETCRQCHLQPLCRIYEKIE